MRNRILILTIFAGLVLGLLSCTMGGGRLASVTSTPTKTMRPVFTSTHTPTVEVPTETALPSDTPAPPPSDTPTLPPPPADTPLPSDTPPPPEAPTAEPLPTETATTAPAEPSSTPRPQASNTPLPPTVTPKPQVDFRIKEIVAFVDGSITKSGFHNIYFTVIDASGAPLDGIVLQETSTQPPMEEISGEKGPGKAEFEMLYADYYWKVARDTGGRAYTSVVTHVLSVVPGHSYWPDLIAAGICPDEAACRAIGSMHYSYNVTFQRTW